jgi:hypothetical protein
MRYRDNIRECDVKVLARPCAAQKPRRNFSLAASPRVPRAVIFRRLFAYPTLLSFILLALATTACAPARVGKYQLRKIEEGLVILPPPYWEQSPEKPIKLQFSAPQTAASAQISGCSVSSGLFRASLSNGSPNRWSVALPSFAAWQSSISNGSFLQEFDNFLHELSRVETGGCLPAGAGALLEQAVRESLPALIHDALYYQYDWRQGGGSIILEPGMRLRIERAEYNPAEEIADTRITSYAVERDSSRAIVFRLIGPKPKNSQAGDLQDRSLATMVHDMFYARLFLSGDHVPNNLRYTALIIGSRTLERMDDVAKSLQLHPENGCPKGPDHHVDCVMFRGQVTASVELQVSVNGQQVSAGVQRDLRSLFDQQPPRCVLPSLHIERRYLSRFVPIEFSFADDSAFGLMLVAGDRIVCSAPPQGAE